MSFSGLSHARLIALGAIASVASLTAYCQLWSSLGHGVPLSASLQWAFVNTAALSASAALLWVSRHRIFDGIEESPLTAGLVKIGTIFTAAACAVLLATIVNDLLWGFVISFEGLVKRLLALSPLLLAGTVAVTAAVTALRWRSAKEAAPPAGEDWIDLPEAPRLRLRTSDVAVIRTAGNYCELNISGREVLVRITAKQLEQRLEPLGFARVHRGAIVNLSRVRVVKPGRSGCLQLLLDDGSELSVSKGHRDVLTERLAGSVRTPFSRGLQAPEGACAHSPPSLNAGPGGRVAQW